jgi:tetratricopeptide (TPR) repeat protein
LRTGELVLFASVIAAAVFVAFAPALSAGFVDWDDDRNFLQNQDYRGLSLANLRWMATTFFGGPYQPLSWLTLGIDHSLWGMDTRGYHFTNVLLHALGAVAFFFLALRLLPMCAPMLRGRSLGLASTAAAVFFAIHPLRAESVAWITERRDVLSGIFFVLSTTSYLRFSRSSAPSDRRRAYAMSIVWLIVGLAAKASGMALPIVFFLLDRWPLRKPLGIAIVEKIPFALVVLPFAALAYWGQASQSHALSTIAAHGVTARVAQAAYAACFYPLKTLLPTGLSAIYDLPVPFDALAPRFVIAIACAASITMVSFASRRRAPAVWSAWIAFLAILAPTSGIVQAGPQLVADRYSYLSCMPFALLAAGATFASAPRVAPACAAIVLCVLTPLTWRQTRTWHDSDALWEHAVASEPESCVAHTNLGFELSKAGRTQEAMAHYTRALELQPSYALAHNSLGQLLLTRGEIDSAIAHFRAAIEGDPRYASAHIDLGVALSQKGETDAAEREFREALRIRPDATPAHVNLANILLARGRTAEAMDEYAAALSIDPSDADAHVNMANVFAQQGRGKLAIEHYRAALATRPSWPEAEIKLSWILATHKNPALRDGAAAVGLAEDVVARASSPSAYELDTLAAAYAEAGRFDDATSMARRALAMAKDPKLTAGLEERIKLYASRQAYRAMER